MCAGRRHIVALDGVTAIIRCHFRTLVNGYIVYGVSMYSLMPRSVAKDGKTSLVLSVFGMKSKSHDLV